MDTVKKCKQSRKSKQHKSQENEIQDMEEKFQRNIEWTNKDKKLLLEGLKKYGSENITAISKLLPNMSSEEIKSKISEYSMTAQYMYEQELLEKWLKCGLYKSGDSLISEALLFIQLFENHPPASESEGYDFRAIYNFLYRSCFEQPSVADLPQRSRSMLCSTLSNVETKTWPKCEKDVWEYLGRVYNRRDIKKVYPGKNTDSL